MISDLRLLKNSNFIVKLRADDIRPYYYNSNGMPRAASPTICCYKQ